MQKTTSQTKTSLQPSGSNGINQENSSRPPLEQQLRDAFPELTDRDFGYQATDLYVVWTPEIQKWLQDNYQFYKSCRLFTGAKNSNWNGAGKSCIDIPFQGYWNK
jgi:hypothetical protein